MRCLITGGAGFIGRWVVGRLLDDEHEVLALDDLSNGRRENLREFEGEPRFKGLVQGDLANPEALDGVFRDGPWDLVLHLGASIHVQRSIDDPYPTFRNDVEGTFRVLEACRREYFASNGLDVDERQFDFERDVPRLRHRRPRVVVMSTCMVYATSATPIAETHPFRPASPYAASKIASDHLALSYYHAYRLPVTVVRPFNTYGPFQKSNGEGGVVSIFLQRDLVGEPLHVKGTGAQTRDLLYVEDCADFIVRAALSDTAEGEVINAGTGSDVSVCDLAELCRTGSNEIKRVPHDHPQAEIMRLCTDASKAKSLLGWQPRTDLEEGLRRTRAWLDSNRWAW